MSSKTDVIKVLFVLNGLTHYFNKVLNKLNSLNEYEIEVLVPAKKNESLGTGVYTTDEGIKFKVHKLYEIRTYYRKQFFKKFLNLVNNIKPQIIILIWPYILQILFNPILSLKLKKNNIKIIYKDIPFQLVKFNDGLCLKHPGIRNEKVVFRQPTIIERVNLFFLSLIRKYIYSKVDANANYTEEAIELLQSYGVSRNKIFITYNSPDTDNLFEASIKAAEFDPILPINKNRIISVGRLVNWKRTDLLIKSLKILTSKIYDIELIIIGTGPQEEKLKKMSQEMNLNKNIKFVGAVYDPILLARYFLSSSVFVQPGMGGLAINEAMCFGKPIVCSVCDGTEKKLVREGYNGIYFKEGSEADLAEKIYYLMNNQVLIKSMGENSLSIIKNEINISTVVAGYEKALKYLSNK